MKSIGPGRRHSFRIAISSVPSTLSVLSSRSILPVLSVLSILSILVLVTGCSPSAQAPANTRTETAAGLSYAVPQEWLGSPPSTNMRAAQYALPADADSGASELVLFYFGEGKGGDAASNIDRWIGMMAATDGKPATGQAKRETRKVGAYTVSLVTADGAYDAFTSMGMSGGMGSAHGTKPKSDYRLWGAVVEGPGGPWFFKATGPRPAMEKAAPALKALIGSLKKGA